MTTAITEYSKTEAALADLAARYKNVVFDVTTTAGMDTARKGRAELREYRVSLEKTRVEIKAPALERCRLIDAEAKRITAELVALEDPIDALIKQEEQRKEREKAAREQAERERIERIRADIETDLRMPAVHAVGADSTTIAQLLADVRAIEITKDRFADFIPLAELEKVQTVKKLEQLHAATVQQEADRADLERLRAEQEQRDREAVQRQREENERIQQKIRERAEADAAALLAIEEAKREARQQIEWEERQARLAREEADRVARIARDAEEAKATEARAAENARLKAERDRIDEERNAFERKQREADEVARLKRQAEVEQQEREERAARYEAEEAKRIEREAEAERQREIQRLETESMDFREACISLRTRFGHRPEAAGIVKAIDECFAPKKKRGKAKSEGEAVAS